MTRRSGRPFGWILLAAALLTWGSTVAAHEIPMDVMARAFVRPQGKSLLLVVRVPLAAMRDVNFPTRGPGFLDIPRAEPALREAATLWLAGPIEIFENDVRVTTPRLVHVRASLPSDRSFVSFDDAIAHVSGSLPADTDVIWDQAMLDAAFEYPIESDRSRFSIRMGLERLGIRVVTAVRYVPPGGAPERAFEFSGDAGLVRLDPRWHQAALRFVQLGFGHILDGIDHLLFLLCLVIPIRRIRPLIVIVTAFTAAHSATLIASAYGLAPDALWFPALVETLIATSIVYMALENIVQPSIDRRWLITFGFGLVHGFGFSFALRERLQFAGSHLLTSLLSFNVGVELGQLLVLALLVPALHVLFKYIVAERIGTIILSAIVAHTGWHWMIDRGSALGQYEAPALDLALLTSVLWWALLVIGVAWAATVASRHLARGGARTDRGARNHAAVETDTRARAAEPETR
jgi:hypothetical protein